MSQKCTKCGSYAININHHGRKPNEDTDLCDVCYWRKRADGFEDFSENTLFDVVKKDVNSLAKYIARLMCVDCIDKEYCKDRPTDFCIEREKTKLLKRTKE